MPLRNQLLILLFLLACFGLSSCASPSGPGRSIDADSVYRAQDNAFRPMAN